MNNIEKGFLYENQIKNFIINNTNFNAYLWNECPETILVDNKLISSHRQNCTIRKDIKEGKLHNHKDIGIDIIQVNNDNICNGIIQCKNGYSNGICISDISGIMIRSAFNKSLTTFIYYTNSLSKNINHLINLNPNVLLLDFSEFNDINFDENNIYFIKQPFQINNDFNDNENDNDNENASIIYNPYEYQTDAVNQIKEHFKENNRSILGIPCGLGKTFISYLISLDYNHIIIISPLKEFAFQNLSRYIDYGYNKNNTVLIDSDGIRDVEIIKSKIQKNKKLLISSTFKSVDIISECLDLFNPQNTLFIIDEFHNLSKNNISDKNDDIYKLLISNHKILFMSATPRIYDIEEVVEEVIKEEDEIEREEETEEEVEEEEEENNNYIDYEDNFNQLFGKVVYNMTLTYAIDNKYITDYKIWLPSIHENNEQLNEELSVYNIDSSLKNRCNFLFSCILNNGSRKTIIYCKDTIDMNSMIESFIELNDFYNIDAEINSISCQNTDKERKSTLKSFANNNNKIQLLFNIRILNECIDIPSCDSIYISYPPKNKITTIQRIHRATRINKSNPYKIANIYIWCDQYDEILETLSSIKEYDIMFKDKIKLNTANFYNNQTEREIKLINKDQELLNTYTIGIREFRAISWHDKLAQVEKYIKENGILPPFNSNNKFIKQLASWIYYQKENYKNNESFMKNIKIKNKWSEFTEKFKKYFISDTDKWKKQLEEIIIYINENNKLPYKRHKDKNIQKCGRWVERQTHNYKNNNFIMKNNEQIAKEWEKFTEKYSYLFKNNEIIWNKSFQLLEKYVIENNKLPTVYNKNDNIKKLGIWLTHQKKNYKYNEDIMKNNEQIKTQWNKFTEKYSYLFKTDEIIWHENLIELEKYIIENNILPSSTNKNIKYLGYWVSRQKENYKYNKRNMKNKEIAKEWEKFIEKYNYLFKSDETIWYENLIELEKYIIENAKFPSSIDKNKKNKYLSQWVNRQKLQYKNNNTIMKNKEITKEWEKVTDKYNYLFKTNIEK